MKKDNVVERLFLGLLTVSIPPALLAAALRLCYSSVTRGFLDVIPSLQGGLTVRSGAAISFFGLVINGSPKERPRANELR